jgi:hypothetical protein
MSGDHSHSHPHTHEHGHRPAGEYPPAGGPVVLDIGDDIGALIVYVLGDDPQGDDQRGDDLVGHELHVRPVGSSGATTHTGIWRRNIADRDDVIAIFPELVGGHYDMFDLHGSVVANVFVPPGAIAEAIIKLTHV